MMCVSETESFSDSRLGLLDVSSVLLEWMLVNIFGSMYSAVRLSSHFKRFGV
jgi:hypothetical protein